MKTSSDQQIERFISSYVPERYQAAELPDWDIDFTKSFYIHGAVGTGKTHAMYGLLIKNITKKVLNPDQLIPIIHVINIAEISSMMLYEDFDVKVRLIKQCCKHSLLILDDLGSERKTDHTEDFLFQVVNHRYEHQMYTGFTSNNKIQNLPYDKRITSRVIGLVNGNHISLQSQKDRRVQ